MNWHRFFFVTLLFICSFISRGTPALSKAALQDTKKLMKNMCKNRSGVKQELLTQLRSGDFVEDQKLKCYIHCCLGMMKTMKNDKITVAEAKKQVEMLLPQDMRESSLKQLDSCKDTGGADACDKAFNFAKCCHGVDPNNWLIPT